MDIVNQIKSMLNRSHSPFHAVKLMEEELIKHGFIKYEESKEEKIVDYVKVICNKLNQICQYKAKRIPILPETVTENDVILSI